MQVDGAIIKEQNVTFAIVIVKPHVLTNSLECDKMRKAFQPYFPGLPIVLMAQDHNGRPTYQGRKDLVNFLANIDPGRIPWKRFTIN